jgi:N-acetylglutamate synthase
LEQTQIIAVEQALFRAWPALETRYHHGWVVRFADGYTRRANSINPIEYAGDKHDLTLDIETCASLYRERGLPVVFRLTDIMQPAELEQALEALGYERKAATLVQTADLAGFRGAIDPNVMTETELNDDWLNHFLRLNPSQADYAGTMSRMLRRIEPPRAFARLTHSGQVMAVGLAVRDGDYAGLFDIATDPQARRQGFGRRLVACLLAWGICEGARSAYLQVVQENVAAQRLYEVFGFQTAYTYWYRVLD